MSEPNKFGVRVTLTHDLLDELQRLGLSDQDMLAFATGKFEDDEHKQYVHDLIAADNDGSDDETIADESSEGNVQ